MGFKCLTEECQIWQEFSSVRIYDCISASKSDEVQNGNGSYRTWLQHSHQQNFQYSSVFVGEGFELLENVQHTILEYFEP